VLAACDSFERGSRTKSHAVPRDRVAGRQTEDAAEMVGRDRKLACEHRQWASGLRRQQLAGAVDEEAASAGRRGSSGSNAGWIDLFESRTDKRDRSFDELVRIDAFATSDEHEPVGEVELWRDRKGT
jgi:hypothetical protein